jgi:uncharacterized tellurite resistance protein B-like protein
MKNTEKLIESFGELLYVLAMADGRIQEEELQAIQQKLAQHKWGAGIQWSFDYERKNNSDPEEIYRKVISYCEMHGPDPEYKFLLELLEEVAEASAGIDADESAVMKDFVEELTTKFRNDLDLMDNN